MLLTREGISMNTRPIEIQCEATSCLFNSAGICTKAAQTSIIEISQKGDSAVCVNFISNQSTVKSE